MKAEEKYIVGKGREWLTCSRADASELPHARVYSMYRSDAAKYDREKDARRAAERIGGKVYVFNPLTWDAREIVRELPGGAECYQCRFYRRYDGVCTNRDGLRWNETVESDGVCEEFARI